MTPEQSLQRLVLDWLAAKRIFAIRLNSGAAKMGNRFVRFATPGCADILACPASLPATWLELKSPVGRQSQDQKSFQRKVEEAGHRYALVRCLEDVEAVLGGA